MVRHCLVIGAIALGGCSLFTEIDTTGTGSSTPTADGGDVSPSSPDMTAQSDVRVDPLLDTGDTSQDGGIPCEAPNVVEQPEPLWATPNTIRLGWSWLTEDPSIETLEVVVGASEADVRARRDVTVFTRDEVAEFAMFSGPNRQSEASIWGLDPDTTYVVQMGAIHESGCRSSAPVFTASTGAALPNEHVIFSEEPTDGYSIPSDFAYSSRNPAAGEYHYEWSVDCDGEASCFEILRRQGLSDTVTIPAGAFDDAIVEFMALHEGTTYGEFWHVRMFVGSSENRKLWTVEYVPVLGPTAVWRLHQIPLRFFEDAETTMTAADISGEPIYEFGMGAVWDAGTYGNWDEVRIRW